MTSPDQSTTILLVRFVPIELLLGVAFGVALALACYFLVMLLAKLFGRN